MEENKRPVEKNPELSVQIITRQTAPRKTALEIELQIHSQFTASCSDCICNPPRVRDWACLQPRAGGTACLTLAVSLGFLGRHQSLPDGVKGMLRWCWRQDKLWGGRKGPRARGLG